MSQGKIYICIIGKIGSGKGTVFDILRDELKARGKSVATHVFSESMGEILDILYLPKTRENYMTLSPAIRHAFDESVFGNVVYERASKDPADVVFIDGARWPKDIVAIKRLPNHHIVFITAPVEVRFERVKQRAKSNRPGDMGLTWEKFMESENAETERQVEDIGRAAETVIDNSGGYEDLRKQVKDFLKAKIVL